MTAINKNFIVKNGLQVGNDLLLVDGNTNRVGIASTIPTRTLSVSGEIGADNVIISGISTITQLQGTQASYTQVDAGTLYAASGIITALSGSNINVSGEVKSNLVAIGVAGSIFSVTSAGVGVGTTIPTKDFEVSGDANVTGALSALVVNSNVNSSGVSTFVEADVTYLETTDFNVLGISTLGFAGATRLTVSSNTTLGITTVNGPLDVSQINVSGITTIGDVNVTQINATGVSTFSNTLNADDISANVLDLSNLNATGIATVGTLDASYVGVANSVAIGTDKYVATLTVGDVTDTVSLRGGLAVKTLPHSSTIGESALYLEEQVGGEGWYFGVDVDGDLNINNSSSSVNTIELLDNDDVIIVKGNVGIGSTLPKDLLTVQGNAKITGVTTLTSTTTGALSASQISVSGVSTFAGITTVTGATLFSKQLEVAGVSTFRKWINVTGVISSDGLTVGSGVTAARLTVNGNATANGINVSGTTTTTQLNVTGVSTLVTTNVTSLQVTNTNVTGILTVSNINPTQINVSGMSTFNNAYVSGSVGVKSTSPTEALDVVGNIKVRGTVIGDGFSGPGIVTSIIDGAGSDAVEVTPGVYRIDLYGSAVGEAWGTVLNGSGETGVRTDVLVGMGTTVPPEYTLDVYAKYAEEAARFIVQGSNVYAPFIVNSNVQVNNLNAQYIGGKSAPSGLIVGTTDSQTLTNKTLTLPTIQGTGAVYSGATSGSVTLKATATAGSNTITLPAITGNVVTTGDSGTVTSTMIANDTITNTDINSAAGIVYSKLSLGNSIVNADINSAAAIAISKLAASTISGISLGNNLNTLTIGAYLTQNGQTYNGSTARTVAVDADTANTASKVVARDGSGNFSAGTITATLTGTASTATTITVADESADTTCNVVYVTAASGSLAPKTGTNLTFNSSTGRLTADAYTATVSSSILGNLKGTLPLLEGVNVVAGTVNGTANIDVLTSNVWMFTTNASANWTHNIRGDAGTSLNTAMATGDSIVVTILAKKGSTTHYATDITIDGAAQTELWLGGSAPTAGLSGSNYDMYTWTIVKTASATFTVFASQSQYGS